MLCDEGDDDGNDSKVQFIKKQEPRSKLKIPTLKVVIEFCSTFREQKKP